jgi:hypothetical protein
MVQLYAADTATGVTLPAQQLVGFARVDLEPGESSTVEFALPLSVLAYDHGRRRRRARAGRARRRLELGGHPLERDVRDHR